MRFQHHRWQLVKQLLAMWWLLLPTLPVPLPLPLQTQILRGHQEALQSLRKELKDYEEHVEKVARAYAKLDYDLFNTARL